MNKEPEPDKRGEPVFDIGIPQESGSYFHRCQRDQIDQTDQIGQMDHIMSTSNQRVSVLRHVRILRLVGLFLVFLTPGCGDVDRCAELMSDPALQEISFSYDDSCTFSDTGSLAVNVTMVKTNTPDCNWVAGSVAVVEGTYNLTEDPDDKLEPMYIDVSFSAGGRSRQVMSCAGPLDIGSDTWISKTELLEPYSVAVNTDLRLTNSGVLMSGECIIQVCVD